MSDDKGQSRVDSAPVQFGIFDWIDRNQLQLPDLYEQRLQCLEYADEAGFYSTMRELFDLYKRVWQEYRTNPDRLNAHVPEPKYGIVRHVYVADTDAQALQEARLAFADFIRNFNYLRVAHGDTGGRAAYLADFDARLAEGLHIVGSPDTVKKRVQEHLQSTGSNYFVGAFCFGTLTTAQTLHSMRLFAEEVMPACRYIGAPGMA